MPKTIIKSKYEIKHLIAEDIISYSYLGYTHYSKIPLLIWKYKTEYLTPKLISKLIQCSERIFKIKHPHILPLLDYHYNGETFYVFYYFSDNLISLDAYLKKVKFLNPETIQRLTLQITSAMVELEQNRLIHGSLNLSNIFLTPKLEVSLSNTLLHILILKRHFVKFPVIEDSIFLAPEFIHNRMLSVRSDIYSLGTLLYFLYTHHWPYKYSSTILKLKKELIKDPIHPQTYNTAVSPQTSSLIMHCMVRNPINRIPSFAKLQKIIINSEQIDPLPAQESPDYIQKGLEQELFVYKRERILTFTRNILLFIAGLLVVSIFYFSYVTYLTAIPEVKIPNILDMPQSNAEKILKENRLKSLVVGSRNHPTIPKGNILEVRPNPGRLVKQNRSIQLFISSGMREIHVPNIVGRSLEQAQVVVQQEGLIFKIIGEEFSNRYQKSYILEQYPTHNTPIPAGEKVKVIVSKGFPVKITVIPYKSQDSSSNNFRSVVVSFQILKNWKPQLINIRFIKDTFNETLYSATHYPGTQKDLHFELLLNGYVEVYVDDDLALKEKILE